MLQKLKSKNLIIRLLIIGVLLAVALILYSVPLANHRKTLTVKKSQELITNNVPTGYSYDAAPIECYEGGSLNIGYEPTLCRILFIYTPKINSLTSADSYRLLTRSGWNQWYSQPDTLDKDNVSNQQQNWLAHFSIHIEKSTLGNSKVRCNTHVTSDKVIVKGECRWAHPDFYTLISDY